MTNFPHILVGTLNLTSDFTFIYQGQRTGGRGWLWRWWECLWWGQFRKKRIESRRRGWRERDIFPSTSLHAEIRQGLGHFVGRTLGSCHQSGGEFLTLLLYRVDVLVYILKDSLGLFVYFSISGVHNSNLMVGQKNFTNTQGQMICFYTFKGCNYQENKLTAHNFGLSGHISKLPRVAHFACLIYLVKLVIGQWYKWLSSILFARKFVKL